LRCNLAGELGRNYADLSLFQLLAGFMEQQEPLKERVAMEVGRKIMS